MNPQNRFYCGHCGRCFIANKSFSRLLCGSSNGRLARDKHQKGCDVIPCSYQVVNAEFSDWLLLSTGEGLEGEDLSVQCMPCGEGLAGMGWASGSALEDMESEEADFTNVELPLEELPSEKGSVDHDIDEEPEESEEEPMDSEEPHCDAEVVPARTPYIREADLGCSQGRQLEDLEHDVDFHDVESTTTESDLDAFHLEETPTTSVTSASATLSSPDASIQGGEIISKVVPGPEALSALSVDITVDPVEWTALDCMDGGANACKDEADDTNAFA